MTTPALGTLHTPTAQAPSEESTWQIAMRIMPRGLRVHDNPSGGRRQSLAWRSVPRLHAVDLPHLWPLGRRDVIIGYIDGLLAEVRARLYGGGAIPQLTVKQVNAEVDGQRLSVELPSEGLRAEYQDQLDSSLDSGLVYFGEAAERLAVSHGRARPAIEDIPAGTVDTSSTLEERSIEVAAQCAGDLFEAVTADGLTDAEMAAQVLQGLSTAMLALAGSIPYGIGYAIAGLLQIATWVAGTWDRSWEPSEHAGWRLWWSTSQKRQVLRYRALILACAEPATIEAIKSMSKGDAETWLDRCSYRSDDLVAGAAGLAQQLDDPMTTARRIKQISQYLRFAGVGELPVRDITDWLWDARRITRIADGLSSGEINPGSSHGSIRNIGSFPGWWRDWAFDGATTPERFTAEDLEAVYQSLRKVIVKQDAPATARRYTLAPGFHLLSETNAALAEARAAQLTVVVRSYSCACFPDLPDGGLDPEPASRSTTARVRGKTWTAVCRNVTPASVSSGAPSNDNLGTRVVHTIAPSAWAASRLRATGSLRGVDLSSGGSGTSNVDQAEIRSESFRAELAAAIAHALGRPWWHFAVIGGVAVAGVAGAAEVVHQIRK